MANRLPTRLILVVLITLAACEVWRYDDASAAGAGRDKVTIAGRIVIENGDRPVRVAPDFPTSPSDDEAVIAVYPTGCAGHGKVYAINAGSWVEVVDGKRCYLAQFHPGAG